MKMIHLPGGLVVYLGFLFFNSLLHYGCSVFDNVKVYCNYVVEFHCFL